MARVIVGVLRGGTSSEYNLSLKTGAAALTSLPEERYLTRDILIDKSGLWHVRGVPSTPARALAQVDVVINALHGGVGEDGTVQRILERAGVPYTGARPLPAGLSLNKIRAREILGRAGIRMPRAVSFTLDNRLDTSEMSSFVFEQFGPPYLVKPVSEGAGTGIMYAKTILDLPRAIAVVLERHGAALVEEFIRGKEASVGIIEAFRNEEDYALPPAHVVHKFPFLHSLAHQEGSFRHVVPSAFTYEQKLSLADLARQAHKALGLSHASRSDLIVTPRAAYLLEINAVPGLYPGASFPAMLEAVGSSVREYVEHLIQLALSARRAPASQ